MIRAESEAERIREIVPSNNQARVVEFEGRTTAIQLRTSFLADWREEVRQGAAFACENSENLIVDVRSNGGGFVSLAQWLARYLQPESTDNRDFSFISRELSQEPTIVELRRLTGLGQAQGVLPPQCILGFESQCFGAQENGRPFVDPDWFESSTTRERRGRRKEVMTRLLVFAEGAFSIEPDETIPCPGRFEGPNLVILVNGLNASSGFFLPEWVRDSATIVGVGGVLGEPMTTGIARGGTVSEVADLANAQSQLADATGVSATREFPRFNRAISLRIERLGAYDDNLEDLFANKAPVTDVQLPIWSNSVETDAAVYGEVLRAVANR